MDNTIFIQDENGKEVEMQILLTFDSDENKYVVCYMKDNEDEIYAFRYDEEGNLMEIETEEEMDMVNEVVSAFDNGEEEEA